jgi:membrane protein
LQLALERLRALVPPEASAAFDRVSSGMSTEQGLVLLALPALLWVATTAFSALEQAVNVAFGTGGPGGLWRARLKAITILAAGWLLLGGMLLMRAGLAVLKHYRKMLSLPESGSGLERVGSYVGLLVLSFLIFVLFFKFLPRTRVSWRAAGSGALLALALWDGARRLFGSVLLHSPALGLLTGTLAGIVTFLLWIYTAVAVVLLGAELAALVNGSRRRAPEADPSLPA